MAKIRKTITVPDHAPIKTPNGDRFNRGTNIPITREELQETAEVYQKHVALGLSGTQALVDTFGYTRRTAARRLQLARQAGLLPETPLSLNAQARVQERGTAYAPAPETAPPTKVKARRLTRAEKRAASVARLQQIFAEELRQTKADVTEDNPIAKAPAKTLKPIGPEEIVIRWEDPPPVDKHRTREVNDGLTWYQRLEPIKAARKEHPKEWGIVRTFKKPGRHVAAASNLTYGLLRSPPGRWEFCARTTPQGEHNVYARFLGPDYRKKDKR